MFPGTLDALVVIVSAICNAPKVSVELLTGRMKLEAHCCEKMKEIVKMTHSLCYRLKSLGGSAQQIEYIKKGSKGVHLQVGESV